MRRFEEDIGRVGTLSKGHRFGFGVAFLFLVTTGACSPELIVLQSDLEVACRDYLDVLKSSETRCSDGTSGFELRGSASPRSVAFCVALLQAPGITPDGLSRIRTCLGDLKPNLCKADQAATWNRQCSSQVIFGRNRVGLLPDGAGCSRDEQCASGECNAPEGTLCGVCARKPTPGSPCSNIANCGVNATCRWGGTAENPTVCDDNEPDIYRTEGEPCTGAMDPGLRNRRVFCEDGLFCHYPSGRCTRKRAEGASCEDSPSDACQGAFVCRSGKCAPPSQDEGQPCGGDSNGDLRCKTGFVCTGVSPNKTCKAVANLRYAAPGESCDESALVYCEYGECSPYTGNRCPALIADGEPCDRTRNRGVCNGPAQCLDGKCQVPNPALCK